MTHSFAMPLCVAALFIWPGCLSASGATMETGPFWQCYGPSNGPEHLFFDQECALNALKECQSSAPDLTQQDCLGGIVVASFRQCADASKGPAALFADHECGLKANHACQVTGEEQEEIHCYGEFVSSMREDISAILTLLPEEASREPRLPGHVYRQLLGDVRSEKQLGQCLEGLPTYFCEASEVAANWVRARSLLRELSLGEKEGQRP